MDGQDGPGKPGKMYSAQEKQAFLNALEAWEGTDTAFAAQHGIQRATMYKWRNAYRAHGLQGLEPRKRGGPYKPRKAKRHMGPYTPDQRLQAVEAFRKSGMTQADFAKAWKVSPIILRKWLIRYEKGGGRALIDGPSAKKRGPKGLPQPVLDQIVEVKQDNPTFGLRSVRDFLMRFRGMKVSTGSVRNTFIREGLPPGETPRAKPKRHHLVRRFERARPGELWQSDITSTVLGRNSQRLYLAVFIDDYSRFIVSWILSTRQTQDIVMDALLEGIGKFGKPVEVLTDQGRQYVSWRGTADFQKLLRKHGIRHVVSRTHHPETLGKCERFWETLQNEFWSRVIPDDLADARERLAHYIAHYNLFRPHQGIGGMVPADRFFGAESTVRKAMESAISRNELDMAVGDEPRKSVYLTGMIGDTPVSLTGERGHLVFRSPDGTEQKLEYHQLGMPQGYPKPTEEHDGDGPEGPDTPTAGNTAGTSPNGPGETPTEGAAQEGIPSPQVSGGPGEIPLDGRNPGGATAGAQDSGPGARTLDGQDVPPGTGAETPDAGSPGIPALPHGALGNGGGSPETAQTTAQGDTAPATGGSQTAPQEGGRTGEAELDPDGHPAGGQGLAVNSGSDGSGEAGQNGEKKSVHPESSQGSDSSSETSSGQHPSSGVTSSNSPTGLESAPEQSATGNPAIP